MREKSGQLEGKIQLAHPAGDEISPAEAFLFFPSELFGLLEYVSDLQCTLQSTFC